MIRTVHVFQCGSADLYGVTQDQTGANLPIDECKEARNPTAEWLARR